MFLENKAAVALLHFLGRHEPCSLHAQQILRQGWKLVPREQPSISACSISPTLQSHSFFCLQFISCVLVQTCKGLQLGALLVSLLLKAYPKSPETSLNKLIFFSYPRRGWILYSHSPPFPIITCFPKICLKVFSVLNFWIFSLYLLF